MASFFRRVPEGYDVEVIKSLDDAGGLDSDFIILTLLSCVIATFGLIMNSAAVIIGAMLVAPLMSPILRLALALVCADVDRVLSGLWTLVVGALIAILLSAILGMLVSVGPLSFLDELPSEVVGRTRPNLFDLIVALAGGTSAAYAMSQPNLSATLPGVAIATALMPPLCTGGIGLSQSDLLVSSGALLLFFTNFVAIVFAGALTFRLVGFQPIGALQGATLTGMSGRGLIVAGGLVLLVSVVLVGTTIGIINETNETRTIRTVLLAQLADNENTSLVGFERFSALDLGTGLTDNELSVRVTVQSNDELTWIEAKSMQDALAGRLQRPINLTLQVVPITTLDAVEPPTPTSTPEPDATDTPMPSPTPFQTPTHTPVLATPTIRPTSTPSQVFYAIVTSLDREGDGIAFLRDPGGSDDPATGTQQVLAQLPDGLLVRLTGRLRSVDGTLWAEILVPDGRVGWVEEALLVPYNSFDPPG